MKLYDAARCPFCVRVRIALAEKEVEYERVEVDLDNRPAWLYDLNPLGKVPVVDDGFVLPESAVIMEYLDERYPTPPLLPEGLAERAQARLLVHRFDELLGDDYYALRRGEPNAVEEKLAALPVGQSLYTDIAYVPWVMRLRDVYDVVLPEHVERRLEELLARSSIAHELEVVRSL